MDEEAGLDNEVRHTDAAHGTDAVHAFDVTVEIPKAPATSTRWTIPSAG